MKPYEAIIELLDEAQVRYEKVTHAPVFTSEQAAAVRGMNITQGAKSLLVKTKDGAFVLAVMPGDKRLDSKKLKILLGAKEIRFATPDEVIERMGCQIGSCYPIGRVAGLRTIVDPSLSENDVISFNPGRHDLSIKLRYADYQKVATPEVNNIVC